MRCPACKDRELIEIMTKNGVLVDVCPECEGIWLDKGEIFYFTKTPLALSRDIAESLKSFKPSKRLNPRTQTPLVEIALLGGELILDYCLKSGGIWLDKGELEAIPGAKKVNLNIELDKNTAPETEAKKAKLPIFLPNLALVSGVTLFSLYAVLVLVLITLVNFQILTPALALLIGVGFSTLQFIISPFLTDLSLRWLYKASWVSYSDLPGNLNSFLKDICQKNNMKLPRIGIILDGSPNAFTYGHTPNNARIVITSGIIDLLEPEELEAVLAHEVGHAVHWDMLVMTVAYLVPLVLYYIFRTLISIRSRGNDKSAPYRIAIAIVAYILYIISQYIVLWLSRVREYFADRFSGQNTSPNSLASALVKIGYGLAGKEKKKEDRKAGLESVKALGVFDPSSAKALAISGYSPHSMGGEVDKESLKGAMKWDLWNPWAMYYELHSTHPLIAKRLIALSRQSEAGGKNPYITFDERKPESYWDEFFFDLLVSALPFLAIVGSIGLAIVNQNYFFLKAGVAFFGFAYLGKIFFSYKFSYFPEMNVASLLKKIKVSAVRPVPCTIEGTIIGRGVPGLIWSEDFVLQDNSGIVFLDYRQPLAIWNWLFGLLRAKQYQGKRVKVVGWYRRSPVPYIEIKSFETDSGKSSCYVFKVKIGVALIIVGLGLFLMI